MNIEKLIHDLRARINPQYYDQLGTESHERYQVVKALEYLATENERLKELMAKRTREHQQEMTSFRLRVRSQDDATFAALREENERLRENAKTIGELEQLAARSNNNLLVENERLREENERQRFDILAMNQSLDLLREENERLRKDAERYQWIRDAGATFYTGGPEITDGSDKVHVCEFAMDAAIDAARGGK